MATKRKPTKKVSAKKPQVSSSQGASYDTLMIITTLLLIFVYPLGIAFMWAWMKTWPTWVKVVITLPLIISLFFLILIFYFVGHAVREVNWNRMYEQQRMEQMHRMMQLTPTPTSQYSF